MPTSRRPLLLAGLTLLALVLVLPLVSATHATSLSLAWANPLATATPTPSAPPTGVAFQPGDVFAGVGDGKIAHYRPNGVGGATRVNTLDTTTHSDEQTGMCFQPSTGDLFATDFNVGKMTRFNNVGLVLQRRLGGIEEDGILDRPALGVRLLGRRIARLGVMQPAQ